MSDYRESQNKSYFDKNKYLINILEEPIKDYIFEKGIWKKNEIIIENLFLQTIEILLEKEIDIENLTKIHKIAKQVCNDQIKKKIRQIESIVEIKNLIKDNVDDDNKLIMLIKEKLIDRDKACGLNFREKLIRHETQLSKYGLTVEDAKYIEKAFLEYGFHKTKNKFLIDECQYIFSLYFGYNISHRKIAEYENSHLLKINNQRKSIEKLSICLRSIFSFAKFLKYKKDGK